MEGYNCQNKTNFRQIYQS